LALRVRCVRPRSKALGLGRNCSEVNFGWIWLRPGCGWPWLPLGIRCMCAFRVWRLKGRAVHPDCGQASASVSAALAVDEWRAGRGCCLLILSGEGLVWAWLYISCCCTSWLQLGVRHRFTRAQFSRVRAETTRES
jgi:hypothetical protein